MMRATRKRIGNPAWLGLALILGLPALAEAQLFPNRNVTRQRPDCANEPPFYSTVRRNYFGYYPTCWSKFPAGWQCPCPNPELPNADYEFNVRQKRDPLPTLDIDSRDAEMPPGDDVAPPGPGRPADDANIPALPDPGRAPFQPDTPPADNIPGRNLPAAPGAAPGAPPRTSATSARPAPTLASSTSATSPTTALLEMPRVNLPVGSPGAVETNVLAGNLAPDATLVSTDGLARPNLGPLPAAPLPDASTPVASGLGADPSLLGGGSGAAIAPPAQAPQRKGILSGLFNSSKRRR